MRPEDLLKEPWAFGPHVFVIDEVRVFPIAPWPCQGMLGWWPVHKRDPGVVGGLDGLVPEHRQRWQALTLQQPYASAIAYGPKRLENRPVGRAIPDGGLWVGLHAGKSLYEGRAYSEGLLAEWRFDSDPHNPRAGLWLDAPAQIDQLPMGMMLGAMHIAQCLEYPVAEPEAEPEQLAMFRRHGLGEPEGGMPELDDETSDEDTDDTEGGP